MKLESNMPSHCAFSFFGHPLEHLHGVLTFVVDYRDAGAVDETYAYHAPHVPGENHRSPRGK